MWDKSRMPVEPFSQEQARALVNLEQRYQVWMECERTLHAIPYDLRRKQVAGRDYLYEIYDRGGNGKSLGPWSPENQSRFAGYHALKTATKARRDTSHAALEESGRLCRALRVPMLADAAGAILREADRRGLLGSHILVVGTNALPAYAIEASGFLRDAPDETDDFNMAWSASESDAGVQSIWSMLKGVDPTFTVKMERTFQARNAKAYEVEIVVAPSRAGTLSASDRPLPEQEWLLNGRPVDRVAACRDGSPARIVAPDPRWFALHKLWMSTQPKRNPLKRAKDMKQGMALLDAIQELMPQYPLDPDFDRSIPEELAAPYAAWKRRGAEAREKSW
jgi:hypothetical protein